MADEKKNKPEWLKDMQRVNLLPGEVLVVRPKEPISYAARREIHKELRSVFPENEVYVLLEDMDIGVVANA